MKHRLLALSTIVLGTLSAQPLLAQTASAPSRADVKAEIPADRTKDARISAERMPPASQQKPIASGENQPKSRAQVRQETKEAIAAGKAPQAGDTDTPVSEAKPKAARKPMSQRRADAKAAREARRPEATDAARNQDPAGGVYDPAKKTPAKP